MKITANEEYGLRCLLRLARLDGRVPETPAGLDGRPVRDWGGAVGRHPWLPNIPEIAAAEGLSIPYAAKVLRLLRRAGLIESVRGNTGGYRLARPPADIRLGTVLLALGEPLFDDAHYCERHAGPDAEGLCVHHDGCTLRALWGTLEGWIRRTLNQITLADLLESEGRIADLLRERLRAEVLEPEGPLITLTTAPRN